MTISSLMPEAAWLGFSWPALVRETIRCIGPEMSWNREIGSSGNDA
jgi:hypothetical protein